MTEARARDSAALRWFLTLILVCLIVATVTLNGLAGAGAGPFNQTTGSVSDRFPTCITPAGYTFSVWSVIYIALILIVMYCISILFRKEPSSQEPIWTLGGPVSPAFLIFYILNLATNLAWLSSWSGLLLTGSAVGLLLISFTNLIAQGILCHSYSKVASMLWQRSKIDFWCGALLVNGYALYSTWTFFASFLNLSIFLIYRLGVEAELVCTVMLSVIPALVFAYALLEALYFVRCLGPLLAPFFIYLWAAIGIFSKDMENDDGAMYELKIFNIALAATLCVQRVLVVTIRNRGINVYCSHVRIWSSSSVED